MEIGIHTRTTVANPTRFPLMIWNTIVDIRSLSNVDNMVGIVDEHIDTTETLSESSVVIVWSFKGITCNVHRKKLGMKYRSPL